MRYLKYVWALPATVFGLLYACLFSALGYYEWHSKQGDGLVWIINESKMPDWLKNMWKGWGGQTIGQVVVVRYSPENGGEHLLEHELDHVRQCLVLGPFQPIAYFVTSMLIAIALPECDPYHDNPFELNARLAADKKLDV